MNAAAIPQNFVAQVRDAVEEYLPQHLTGSSGPMRVVATTCHQARTLVHTAIDERLGKYDWVELPPDPRVVYVVVLEGDFRIRPPSNRTGAWLAVYVLSSMRVLGFQLVPPELAPRLDLNALGPVHRIERSRPGP